MSWFSRLRLPALRADIAETECLLAEQMACAHEIHQLLYDWKPHFTQTAPLIERLIELRGLIAWNQKHLEQQQARLRAETWRPQS